MPREKRERSGSGIYHIMLRGINRQRIFEDDGDRERFLDSLDKALEKSGATLYAWCLMGNHVHLLLREGREEIGKTMKRLGAGYVRYYNGKNGRSGGLFQDRYRSECVESDEYFLTVVRYIHQNPVKAGLCGKCKEWKYSSYREYENGNLRTDVTLLWSLMRKEHFMEWVEEPNKDVCLEEGARPKARLSDEELRKQMRRITGTEDVTGFQALEKKAQEKALGKLKGKGATIGQLQRMTGLSYYAIQKA